MTKERIGKLIVYLICLLAGSSTVLAANLTIDKLIDSYDYDFDTGVINVTTFSDYMTDQNGNGLNDTLIINLTTNALNSSTYLFIVSLNDKTGLLKNYTNVTVNSTSQSALVLFDTKLLNLNQYNYSVELRGQDYGLFFSKYKVQTNNYQSYEKGVNITSISDASVNNSLIRVTLSLNVTENKTTSITVHLRYNNQSVSSTKEVILTMPSQTVDIDFDNETIKSSHYVGNYSIGEVKIGEKLLAVSYNTSPYNYADFAKSSYIKSIISGAFDNNSNNLSEALQFNFTVNITEAGNYSLEAALYESSGEYVTTVAKNSTLNTGEQTVTIEVSGKVIYSTYFNGVFNLSFAKLYVGNATEDILYDAHEANFTYYTDFERPPLPDLAVSVNASFLGNNLTNITVNITNIGEAPAFNIELDVFDNLTYENSSTLAYLAVNDSVVFNFSASNTTNGSLFAAIVDLENFVDESNESNNFVDSAPPPPPPVISLKIASLSQLYSSATHKAFEFIIENNGSSAVSNVTWKFNLGDGTVVNSSRDANLTVNETMQAYFEYNYSSEGSYLITANATSIAAASVTSTASIPVEVQYFDVSNFSVINSSGTVRAFEAYVKNYLAVNMTNVSWSLNTGNGVVSSTSPITLPQETAFVYVMYNYTSAGAFAVNFTAVNGSWSDLEALNVTVT